jgi:hypothetical protein
MPHIFTKSFKTLTRRFKPGDSVGAGDLDGPLTLADLEAGGFVQEAAEEVPQLKAGAEEAPASHE